MVADDNAAMSDSLPITGATRLVHWGVIRARGDDAATFLQGQLTNDIAALGNGRASLGGYCSAKGRLLASFVTWQASPGVYLLACSADVLAATLKRLSMFVMRAKCKLDDASAELPLWGLAGDAADALLGDAAPQAIWQVGDGADGQIIRLPDAAGARRFVAVGIEAPTLPELPLDTWRWLEVQSGVPTIEAATVEQFVPQMINFEAVGGVSFSKGCYPGQEIVARSQYRGTLKRRMALFDIDGVALAGLEVFHSGDAEQPAGMVVNAAQSPSGGSSVLVEVKLAALQEGSLRVAASEGDAGATLRPLPLPYSLQNDLA